VIAKRSKNKEEPVMERQKNKIYKKLEEMME